MLCPKCKNPIDDNATVCEWCGADFATEETEKGIVFCPKCKNSVKKESATCEWCGYKIRVENKDDKDAEISSWSTVWIAILLALVGFILTLVIAAVATQSQ